MSTDRAERRRARREEALALDASLSPGQWLGRQAIWPVAVAGLLAGIGLREHDPGVFVPILAIGLFWGGALLRGYLTRQARAAQAARAPLAAPLPSAALSPVSQAPSAPVAAASPSSELGRLVASVAQGLRRHGREAVARTLDRGLEELCRVEPLIAGLGAGESVAELRVELADMQARAAAAEDAAARALWSQNALAVERRIQKRRSLAAAHDRVSARVEGFRQAVKSLALDVAQLDLVGEAGAGLERVDEQAQGVEREVSALLRAHEELAALEAAPPLRARQAGTEAPEAEAAPAAVAARARTLG